MVSRIASDNRVDRLLNNSRFWVLSFGLVCSIIILGLVQQFVPSGNLQTIRLEQTYGFTSLFLLLLALFITPLIKLFPRLPYKELYVHSRRPLGVLTFYYAALHASLAFFKQLKGFAGIRYLDGKYETSLLVAVVALFILLLMAITSTDWAVQKLTFKNWKRLHRFVYLAGVLILLHILLIGTHFIRRTAYFYLTLVFVAILVCFEVLRIVRGRHRKNERLVS